MIVVSVLPTDVLVIAPRTIHEMGVVAHSLGNRHLQAQFFDAASEYGAEVMVCQYDHTVEDYLKHVGVPYDRQERVMPVPFRHAEHSHYRRPHSALGRRPASRSSRLQQLTDSALPTGAFAHSLGFETYIERGLVAR